MSFLDEEEDAEITIEKMIICTPTIRNPSTPTRNSCSMNNDTLSISSIESNTYSPLQPATASQASSVLSPSSYISPKKIMKRSSTKVTSNTKNSKISNIIEEEENSSEDSEMIYTGRIAPISPMPFKEEGEEQAATETTKLIAIKEQQPSLVSKSNKRSIYLQSLVLGLGFCITWLPQNMMAPNLTQLAHFFGFTNQTRDVLLGANIAFAMGVLSFPICAIIGFCADTYSRKYLYACVVFGGALSSLSTAMSQSYTQLYISRFVCGGCMSGSTTVSFSLLGDYFETKDRNAASSGLTAMMGVGIIVGQILAGYLGPKYTWQVPFQISAVLGLFAALAVLLFIREPERGGTEKVLQDMIQKGIKYEKKLTFQAFRNSLLRNKSNVLLILSGFFSSVPWGIIFVFLNDYLSQEEHMSVPDATFLVFVFGIGCGIGGIGGGVIGQKAIEYKREYLPIFMALSTFFGIFPFVALLNDTTLHRASLKACFYSLLGGTIANLPSVNVRPAIISVNPPEIRGATLAAANIIINGARGIGPMFLTTVCAVWNVDRRFSFNVLLISFWIITTIQLLLLALYLPHDQDNMEQQLAQYANDKFISTSTQSMQAQPQLTMEESCTTSVNTSDALFDDEETVISIADRTISFDNIAAEESMQFFGEVFRQVTGSKRDVLDQNRSFNVTKPSKLFLNRQRSYDAHSHTTNTYSNPTKVHFNTTITTFGNNTIVCQEFENNTDIDVIHHDKTDDIQHDTAHDYTV